MYSAFAYVAGLPGLVAEIVQAIQAKLELSGYWVYVMILRKKVAFQNRMEKGRVTQWRVDLIEELNCWNMQ